MRNMLLLTWTMFRGTQWGVSSSGSARRRKLSLGKVGNLVLILLMVGYFAALTVLGVRGIYPLLAAMSIQSVIPSLVVSLLSMITFLFGVMYAMSVYYHASDIEKLLPLPFTPGQIVFSKFLTTLLYEYLMVLLLGLPALATYGILNGEGILYYIWTGLILLILPVTPLALASVLVILLMRFSPAARNKDRFNMIANILVMAVTLALVFSMQRMQTMEGSDLAAMLARGAADLAEVTAGVFPGSSFAAAALAEAGTGAAALRILGFLAVCAVAIVLLMLCAKVFYFKGVMGVGASYAKHRSISQGEMESFSTAGSAFWIYVRKDFRILVRTPVFFMNNFLMNFLFPLFFFVPLAMSISDEGGDFTRVLEAIRTASFGGDGYAGPIVLGALSALAIFVCGMNGITASAISREGGCAYIMKVIPMSYRAQVRAKVAMGVLVSAIPALILLVAAIVLLHPPFWFTLLMAIVLAGAVLLPNLMGILFDLARPKLHWTDEQKAVKQNVNVLYAMGISMVLAALACVPAILLQINFGAKATFFSYVAAVGFPLLADLLFYLLMNRNAPRHLRAMQP